MDALNLPPYDIKVSEKDGKRLIFDELRRRHVALTPEEWVRQHFVHYLIGHLGYPAGLLANEVELKIGDKRLRCDSARFRPTICCCMLTISSFPTACNTSAAVWTIRTTRIISCRRFLTMRK